MNCLKCKQNIDEDSLYCKYCGKKQTKTEKSKELKKPNGYGSVIKLPGRRRKPWAVRVTDSIIEGKQIYRYVSYHETKKEALEALTKEQICPTPPKAKITLSALYNEWSETKSFKDLSKSTQDNYKSAHLHLTPLHNLVFNDLRTAHFEALIDSLEKSSSTKKKNQNSLWSAL